MDFTFFELNVGLPSMTTQFLSSRLRFHEGLCSFHHQGWLVFQDWAVSRGKPKTTARSIQKVRLRLKRSDKYENKKTQAQMKRISLNKIMKT